MDFLRIAKSETLSMNERSLALAATGRTVYRFGFGESPFPPPRRVQVALSRAAWRTEYTAVAGLPELREKIAAFHEEADGYPITADNILVAPGTKPLLYNVMRAFHNLEVYLPGPSWVSYWPQADIAGHDVFRIPTTFDLRWRVTPEELDGAITRNGQRGRQKLLVLNYPGNPDGLTYEREELEALARVLRKHKAWVISDEIYALLDHRGAQFSMARIYPERSLVSTGLSKWCGAGGWRLGALILPPDAPPAMRAALVALGIRDLFLCPGPDSGRRFDRLRIGRGNAGLPGRSAPDLERSRHVGARRLGRGRPARASAARRILSLGRLQSLCRGPYRARHARTTCNSATECWTRLALLSCPGALSVCPRQISRRDWLMSTLTARPP